MSYQRVDQSSQTLPYIKSEEPGLTCGGKLLFALGIISAIGSFIATGFLHAQLGYYSFAIAGGGGVIGLICSLISFNCCVGTGLKKVTPPQKEASFTPEPDPLSHVPSAATPRASLNGYPPLLPDPFSITPPVDPTLLPDPSSITPPEDPTLLPKASSIKPSVAEVKEDESEEEADSPLPPLPSLLEFKLDGTHELSTKMATMPFIKKGQDVGTLLFGALLGGTTDAEVLYGSHVLDSDLLSIPLSFWIDRNPTHYRAAEYSVILSDPLRQHQVSLINSRIEAFDQAIQLKERMKRLGNPYIPVEELISAWSTSPLRLKLMLNEELRTLSLKSVAAEKVEELRDHLLDRVTKLAQKRKENNLPSTFTKESIEEILLIDLPKLKASDINQAPQLFPPIVYLLIAKEELQHLDTTKMTTEQLELLYSSSYYNGSIWDKHYYIELLQPKQINDSIRLINNKKLFENLSESQALQFDLSQIDEVERKQVFDLIFNATSRTQSKAAKLFEKMELSRIYELVPYFSDAHWQCLPGKHIILFDLSKIDKDKRTKVCGFLFGTYGGTQSDAAKLFKNMELSQIYEWIPYFSDAHWQSLPGKHIILFDPTKIDKDKRTKVCGFLLGTYGGTQSDAAKLFKNMDLSKIYEWIPYFSDAHWQCLPGKHIILFDLSKIDKDKRTKVCEFLFDTYGGTQSDAAKLFKNMDLSKIYEWIPYFSEGHWKCIDEAKILAFDYSNIPAGKRKKVCAIFFDTYGGSSSDAAKLLPKLSDPQLDIVRPELGTEALKYCKK